jgi:MerR family transcriptional regulator, mercuric resistance operon regulatory protein
MVRSQELHATFTIGRLADAAGVHVETIRYYQRRGLIAEPARDLGSVRRYSAADADQLRFIKRAQAVGFTLAEIQALVRARYNRSCKATRTLAAEKLQAVEQRMKELSHLRRELLHWIDKCDANSKSSCCPTLDALEDRPARAAGRR